MTRKKYMTRKEINEMKKRWREALATPTKPLHDPVPLGEIIDEYLEGKEPCEDCIKIPEGATNGDMIKTMFPNAKKHESTEYHNILFAPSCHLECCNEDWWNSPYRKEQK